MTGAPCVWVAGDARIVLHISPNEPVLVTSLISAADHSRAGSSSDKRAGIRLVEVDAGAPELRQPNPNLQRDYPSSRRLRYVAHDATADQLRIIQQDPSTGLRVTVVLEHCSDSGGITSHTELCNTGTEPISIRYVSSFQSAFDIEGSLRDIQLAVPFNGWCSEYRWQKLSLEQAGLVYLGPINGNRSTGTRFKVGSSGGWSTGGHLPSGAILDERSGTATLWQIEHNGAWTWAIDDTAGSANIRISGPNLTDHQWLIRLAPDDHFSSIPCTVVLTMNGITDAFRRLTTHRRTKRRHHQDNVDLPIIFNDYMNCLQGNPSAAKLRPLIKAAARLGAEYFVIDAGWFSDESMWWFTIGAWEEAPGRFPHGLKAIMNEICTAGMIPGLWIEPELVGNQSPTAELLPADAFFATGPRRTEVQGRFPLDFRNPVVTRHLTATVDRLIDDYGIGYLKLDYNVNPGVGTDHDVASPGAGLLDHNRAVLDWLDNLRTIHPELIIENCSGGGMRNDQAQLSRLSIASTSDQQDPVTTTAIAAAAPTAMPAEQAGVWAYPQPEYDHELTAYTMINSMLSRIHLSGRIDQLDGHQATLVADALNVYRRIRSFLRKSLPLWPLGLPGWYDDWIALGQEHAGKILLAVWRRSGAAAIELPFPAFAGHALKVTQLYPTDFPTAIQWRPTQGVLQVGIPTAPAARLFELTLQPKEQ